MRLLILTLILTGSQQTFAQTIKSYALGATGINDEICNRIESRGLRENDMMKVIEEILETVYLPYTGRLVECENLSIDVCAFIEDGQRWIAYDASFMDKVLSDSQWSAKGILAHELAHHLKFHTMYYPNNLIVARSEELDADDWAGYILGRLGATEEQALEFLNTVEHPLCQSESFSTHPCKENRIRQVKIGWNKGKKALNSNNTNPESQDSDGDGLIDIIDDCPTAKGQLEYRGCPVDSLAVLGTLVNEDLLGLEYNYSGELRNNLPHGIGTAVYSNAKCKRKKYEGEFFLGQFHGHGNMTWKSGSTYSGQWLNGERTGKGLYTWFNNSRYEGDFKENKKHGQGTYISSEANIANCPDCVKYVGEYINDKKMGQGKCYDKEGRLIYSGPFENNCPVDIYPNK